MIPKYHHNLVSFLTPVLGLYGINVKEFITEFESKTKFIDFDIIIPVRVKISKIKTFQIYVKTPYITSILANLPNLTLSKSSLNILTVYKLTLLKSIFTNYMANFQKLIYISIRKYLSLIIKSSFLIIGKINLENNFINLKASNLLYIKHSISNIKLLKSLNNNRFGVFTVFNNVNGWYLNYLKTSLSFFNMSINKIKPKLLSSMIGHKYFYNNIYYISSNGLGRLTNFIQQMLSKSLVSNFFPIYFRFNVNLLTTNFFKLVLASFHKINFNNNIALLRVLNFLLYKTVKSFNYLNKNFLFLLNYKVNKII